MKKVIPFTQVLLAGFLILFFSECKKTGPPGPEGPPGKNGTTVSSTTFEMASWEFTSPYYFSDLSVPELTQANIDSALVMVYFSTIGPEWFALPYTQYNSPFNYYMGFVSKPGNVQVTWVYNTSLSSGSSPNTYYGTTIKCKVVIVPPAMRKAKVNHADYDEVKTSYSLQN